MPREPSTQATRRREARSTASQSHTLWRLRPTKVHISSSSSASHCFLWAFFGCQRGKAGAGSCAFFYPFGNRVTCHARQPHDAAQRHALKQQLVHLGILPRFLDGRGLEIALVAAGFTLVFSPSATIAVTPNLLTGALGAYMLGVNQCPR